jgi:hypothetical protein
VDEVRLFNRALSQAEVMTLSDAAAIGPTSGLIAYYGFEDATDLGQALATCDSSANQTPVSVQAGVNLNNKGNVNVTAGAVLEISGGGGTSNGMFTTDGNLRFLSGSYSLDVGTVLNGKGNVTFAGTATQFGAKVAMAKNGSVIFSSGTINLVPQAEVLLTSTPIVIDGAQVIVTQPLTYFQYHLANIDMRSGVLWLQGSVLVDVPTPSSPSCVCV